MSTYQYCLGVKGWMAERDILVMSVSGCGLLMCSASFGLLKIPCNRRFRNPGSLSMSTEDLDGKQSHPDD